MIFELLYVDPSRSQDDTPTGLKKNLKAYLRSVENLKPADDGSCSYVNSATGVEATFVTYRPEYGDEIGLAFEMELPRPTFFALEALPAALCVARERKMGVEVLLNDGSKFYADPSFEDLLEEWRRANAQAVEANGRTFKCGPADTLESMWEFSIVRKDLARRYGRSRIEVPGLYPVIHKRSGTVGRMVDWENLEKVALGESEWIRLVDPPKPLKNGSIYSTEELTVACKPLIRTVPQPIFHYLCDKAKVKDDLIERIAALKPVTMRSFEKLELSELYDEEGV